MLLKIGKVFATLLIFVLFALSSLMAAYYAVTYLLNDDAITRDEIIIVATAGFPALMSIFCLILLWKKPKEKKGKKKSQSALDLGEIP